MKRTALTFALALLISGMVRLFVFGDDCNLLVVGVTFLLIWGALWVILPYKRRSKLK